MLDTDHALIQLCRSTLPLSQPLRANGSSARTEGSNMSSCGDFVALPEAHSFVPNS